MRKLLLALLLALCSVPAAAQNTQTTPAWCNKFFQVNQGAVAQTKIISGIASQTIGLCGWYSEAGAAASTFTLVYGTGSNCATGTTTVIPVVTLGISESAGDHVPFVNLPIPSVNGSGVANDVCITTTGTGPTSIIVYYTQF